MSGRSPRSRPQSASPPPSALPCGSWFEPTSIVDGHRGLRRADAAMPASSQPADSATAVARVAASVRAGILSGALAPGAPLREEAAAAEYGVSRHTVRAAFQRLVVERLAVAAAYRGVRVASFDRAHVIALQQLRAALEVEAVRIAGERFGSAWPDEVLAPARAALDRLEELATGAGDPAPGEAAPGGSLGDAGERAPNGDAAVDWLEVERVHADFHRAL